MALAKDQTSSCSFFRNMLEAGSTVQFPHISPFEFDDYNQKQDGDSPFSNNNNKKMMSNHVMSISHSPPLSSSSSANSSNGFTSHHPTASSGYPHHEEAHSLINFKTTTGFHATSFVMQGIGGSLLSFQQDQDQTNDTIPKLSHSSIDHHHHYHPLWEGSSGGVGMNHQQSNQLVKPLKNNANLRLMDEVNCLQTASSSYQDSANEWLYCAEASMSDPPQESASQQTQQTCFNNKRPHTEEENMHAPKKQNTSISASNKAAKSKSSSSSKDPQSIAAKNRRERISERLKILQDLVPNGSKVDLVTMLEKAISYVKFLQLQVKVLATDEFWPAAGGKAPDISQVREAIDAILSSQRSDQRTTSSSSK